MACQYDFERYLERKSDEIDNASYALAAALLRTYPEQTDEQVLPWDISVLALIIEAAQEELERMGKQVCYPYFEDAKPCCRTGGCKNKRCYFNDEKGGFDTE